MTPDTAVTTDDQRDLAPTDSDALLAEAAYTELERLFVAHICAFMSEPCRYIIDTFYSGDARAALYKGYEIPHLNSLRLLLDKLRSSTVDPSSNAPSVSWFYRTVRLAAHDMIFEERRAVATLQQLGLSHKLLLLSVPKIAMQRSAPDEAAIDAAFDEKERLARIAVDEGLSVRDFAERIRQEHPRPEPPLRLDALPSPEVLREQPPATLRRLYDTAQEKIAENHASIRRHQQALYDLGAALAEQTGDASQDPFAITGANAVGVCTGCANDCLYCPEKIANAGIPERKQPADWHRWELRPEDVDAPRALMDGPVKFPAGHDIFPEILDASIEVLGKLLRAGNTVLIPTRPRLGCIRAICAAGAFFRDRIHLSFGIGAGSTDFLSFWEPTAPTWEERRACLEYARGLGFRTSATIDPMLDTPGISHLVREITPFVSEQIRLGVMHPIDAVENWSGREGFDRMKELVSITQTPDRLAALYDEFRTHPAVTWSPQALSLISGQTTPSNPPSVVPER